MEAESPTPPEPEGAPEPKTTRKWLPIVVILVVVAVLLAAGGVFLLGGLGGQVLDHLEVTPTSVSLNVTDLGQQFTAKAVDANGAEISDASITWTVTPEGVALVSGTAGKSITVDPFRGSAIAVTASSSYKGVTKSAAATITVNPYPDRLTISAPASVVSLTAFDVTVSVFDQNNAAFPGYKGVVALTSSDTGAQFPSSPYTFSGSESSHLFAGSSLRTPGVTSTVRATDTSNASLTAVANVQVQNQGPHAGFTYTVSTYGDRVSVDASTSADPDGTIASYAWNWGDGSAAGSGKTASHVYATAGTKTITLTVTDDLGATGTHSESMLVNTPPEPSFTATATGMDVSVDASGSIDHDGSITAYMWDWGDGSPRDSGVMATHTYADHGNQTIQLLVTDNSGATNGTSKTVVALASPNVLFTAVPGGSSSELVVNASGSTDPNDVFFSHLVNYSVNWGDGSITGSTLIVLEARHTYASGGNKVVTVTVYSNRSLFTVSSTTRCVGAGCNPKPVAVFDWSPVQVVSAEVVNFSASGSYDLMPGHVITNYYWEFGDGSTPVNLTVSWVLHVYATYGTYKVNLTVTDDAMVPDTIQHDVAVFARPIADFTYTVNQRTVNVNGGSSSDADDAIVSYQWDWGDSSPASTGVTSSHTYARDGNYPITLFVTDASGLVGRTTQSVIIGHATLDFTYYDWFNVPYGEWWDMRRGAYGDLPIRAACFNATAIGDGYCDPSLHPTLPRNESYPYTDWFPSPVAGGGAAANDDPLIYAPYRFDVVGKNISGYDLSKPVLFPNCQDLAWAASLHGAPVPWTCPTPLPTSGGKANFSIDLQYMDVARETEISTGAAPNDCPDVSSQNDGFILETYFRIDMDNTAAQRLFGVSGTPATWWSNEVKSGCSLPAKNDPKSGPLERLYAFWLESLANGPYDIYTGYQAVYGTFFLDMSVTFTGSGSNQITHLTIHTGTWGTEILLARLFYYGRTTFVEHFTTGAPPTGWWGMELGWFEDFHMAGNFTEESMNFTLDSVMQYHFQEIATEGPDGQWNTPDDQPKWQWQPTLVDYVYSTGNHPYSELDPYLGLTYLHTTPGSPQYAKQYKYDYVPVVWRLVARQTQTFVMPDPSVKVAFHNPYTSPQTTDPWGLVQFLAPLTFDSTVPPSLGTWDAPTHTLTIVGPTTISNPPMTGNFPLESRAIVIFKEQT